MNVKQKILIADDSEINRALLMEILGDGYEYLEAENGVRAVELLREHTDIALVLLDIMMPQMDGFDVLKVMRCYSWLDEIPVIMISAAKDTANIERAYDLGVADYMRRPFERVMVLRQVQNVLMLYAKQKRLTRGGREFEILKFRSMIVDAEKYAGAVLASEDDPRITKVGKVIRAARLDELLMIVGACAGSTGGGVKVSRLVILCKALGSELRKLLHPRSVRVLTVDGKPVSRETVQGVQSYMTLYFLVTMVSVLLVALDNLDFVTTFTAVMATLNNIGPGLGLVGPTGCFAAFSPLAKIVLTADMLFGRLELFPMLILLMPSTWRKY